MTRFDRTIIIPEERAKPPASTWQPTRAPSVHADVVVPIYSALISAALIALSVLGLTLLFVPALDPRQALKLAAGVFVVTATGAWFWLRNWAASTIERVEEALQVDINRDGQIGTPDERHVVVNGNGRPPADAARATRNSDLAWFIQECFRVGKTSEKTLVGKRLPDGRRLTQRHYDEMKGALLRARWARRRGLLRGGWEFIPGYTPAQIIREALGEAEQER